MSFDWQDADLQRLADVLGKSNTVEAICNFASADIEALIDTEFTTGQSAFGVTWATLATGQPSHLIETGQLCASTRVHGSSEGFEIEIDDLYRFHQDGTVHMPQRPVLPVYGEIPDQWAFALEAACEELLAQVNG